MRQQRDCFTALITACKSPGPGARPRPQPGAFPGPVGSGAPRRGCSPGGAQAAGRVPGQGRRRLGDSLTRSPGSHHAGQVCQCPAQQGHVRGHSQGHSQAAGQGDGGFSLLLSLWGCPHPRPGGQHPLAAAPHIRVGAGAVTLTVVAPTAVTPGPGGCPRLWLPGGSTTGPDPALLGTVGPGCAQRSTKHRPHRADPTREGPSPPCAPAGKRLPGQPLARAGCSRPRCVSEGILARTGSRKSFQDLLAGCQLAGSCPARAARGTGGARSPRSPGQGEPRAALG